MGLGDYLLKSNTHEVNEHHVCVVVVVDVMLTLQEEELEVVPTLREEVERLREALSQEQESKEEGLHVKDGEIAMLKAKVPLFQLQGVPRFKGILCQAETRVLN